MLVIETRQRKKKVIKYPHRDLNSICSGKGLFLNQTVFPTWKWETDLIFLICFLLIFCKMNLKLSIVPLGGHKNILFILNNVKDFRLLFCRQWTFSSAHTQDCYIQNIRLFLIPVMGVGLHLQNMFTRHCFFFLCLQLNLCLVDEIGNDFASDLLLYLLFGDSAFPLPLCV